MNTFILYLWIATAGSTHFAFESAWRPSGEFFGAKACAAAIHQLGVKAEKARCIDTGSSK